jgi:phospholipid-binding lipoprotein MlaA
MNIIPIRNVIIRMAVLLVFLTAGTAFGADLSDSQGRPDGSVLLPTIHHADVQERTNGISPETIVQAEDKVEGIGEGLDAVPQESLTPPEMPSGSENTIKGTAASPDNNKDAAEEKGVVIADPLEPFNRAMYLFNDRFYFWLLKPVALGYRAIVPEPARVCVGNFFFNLEFPIRFVSFLLQADLSSSVTEIGRFGVNTTIGIAGFFDPASHETFNLRKRDTDLGLAFASWGIGHGFYIEWPILGPSSPRDTLGTAGGYFLDPVSYIPPWYASIGVRGYEEVNDTSLKIGDYESLKEAAIDPYVAIRDAYVQYRQKQADGK